MHLTPRRERWLLITLAGIQFTHILDFMIMMPLGPEFIRLFGIDEGQFGWLVSAYTLSGGAAGLIASTFIDRFDRRNLLLMLYALFALATLACGLAPTFGFLMAARIAAGLFGGVLGAMVQTIVADVVPFERRGRAMSVVMTSFSAATVAGVPAGLLLAAHWGWHAPFFAIAGVCLPLLVLAAATFPALNQHMAASAGSGHSTGKRIGDVLADPDAQKTFVFSALLMGSGFTVIPFISLFMQFNMGFSATQIPLVYLCGGIGTLLTARWFGRATDARGKVPVYRLMAMLVMVPLVAITVVPRSELWVHLLISTALFVSMSGRMIPGMSIISSAVRPQHRGTFMTLNASVQSAAMGIAAWVGGHLIQRNPQGLIEHYWMAAAVGVLMSIAAIWWVGKLTLYTSVPRTAA